LSNIPDVTKPLTTSNPTPPLNPAQASNTRDQALFETTDSFGRLIQELGTLGGGAAAFMNSKDQADTVQLVRNPDGSQSVIEVWRVFNTTGDTHPIHLHQVSFQILSRQDFTAVDANGIPYATPNPGDPGYFANTAGPFSYTLIGTATGPYANEVGAWKDTVQMNPGQVTTIIAKFDLPGNYVWHCHILEHEEHDMMHWLIVKPAPAAAAPMVTSAGTGGAAAPVSAVTVGIPTPVDSTAVTAAPAAVMDSSKTSANAVLLTDPAQGYTGPVNPNPVEQAQNQLFASYGVYGPQDPTLDPLATALAI
jgi:hypothetical protein